MESSKKSNIYKICPSLVFKVPVCSISKTNFVMAYLCRWNLEKYESDTVISHNYHDAFQGNNFEKLANFVKLEMWTKSCNSWICVTPKWQNRTVIQNWIRISTQRLCMCRVDKILLLNHKFNRWVIHIIQNHSF